MPVIWIETDREDPRCDCGGHLVKHTSAGRGWAKEYPDLKICDRCWHAWTESKNIKGTLREGRIQYTYVVSRRRR